MMVVGFNWPLEHDNTVALILDGELVFATEEERYTRHKHSPNEFPFGSFSKLFDFMHKNNLKPSEIDAFALNFNYKKSPLMLKFRSFENTLSRAIVSGLPIIKPKKDLYRIALLDFKLLAERFIKHVYMLNNEKMPDKIKIIPVEHHLAHAASAYYFSGFGSCAGLVLDGFGEKDATSLYHIKNGEFEKILSIPATYGSIGLMYEAASYKLGYEFLEGPGKLMGLAPYGNKSKYYDRLKKFLKIDSEALPFYFEIDEKEKSVTKYREPYEKIFDRITPKIKWNKHGELNKNAADFAWAVQKVAEEAVLSAGEYAKKLTGEDKLVMAGGVALNAKANMGLYYANLFNDLFIFPAANDAGTTIGAAAYVYEHELGGKMKNKRLENVYLGPEYSDDEIKNIINSSKFRYEYIGNDVGAVANLVKKGNIVTFYQGRAELGPRALGNRSIIANPMMQDTWKTVNKIKGREWWRPLAPSLLKEHKKDYFINPVDHEFMILMFKFKEGMKERVPAVYHVDGTARPQTVSYQQNKNWYNMIKAFGDETGEYLVVNTSFNLAGEPLVESPKDALKSFGLGGFDAMYMQGWLIYKH
jgi:carbamoyltransferase